MPDSIVESCVVHACSVQKQQMGWQCVPGRAMAYFSLTDWCGRRATKVVAVLPKVMWTMPPAGDTQMVYLPGPPVLMIVQCLYLQYCSVGELLKCSPYGCCSPAVTVRTITAKCLTVSAFG